MTMAPTAPTPRRMTMKLAGEVVAKGFMRQVPVAVIKIDPKYQREAKQHWIDSAGAFDVQLATTVVLSSRAGGPYCIDGGHRIALARHSGVATVNAFVIDGLTQGDEANLFVKLQRMRTALTSYQLFVAEKTGGNPETLAMIRIVANAGFHLSQKSGGSPTAITAIDSIRYIHRYGGDDLLSRTLDLVREIWFGEEKALSGPVLKGLALFLFSAGQQPSFRRERLIKVMTEKAPTKLGRLAQAIADKRNAASAGPANFAEALLDEYNKPQVTALPAERLPALTISGRRRPNARGAGRS